MMIATFCLGCLAVFIETAAHSTELAYQDTTNSDRSYDPKSRLGVR